MADTEMPGEAEAQAFRAARIARLTSETGWLTLVGRYLLAPGDNQLPFGTVMLNAVDGTVSLAVAPGAEVTLRGQPLPRQHGAAVALRSDLEGGPDPVR